MRKFLVLLVLICSSSNAQTTGYNGYYNGWGYVPGFSINQKTGWAETTYPAGSFHFKAGYQYPRPIYNTRTYPNIAPRMNYYPNLFQYQYQQPNYYYNPDWQRNNY